MIGHIKGTSPIKMNFKGKEINVGGLPDYNPDLTSLENSENVEAYRIKHNITVLYVRSSPIAEESLDSMRKFFDNIKGGSK